MIYSCAECRESSGYVKACSERGACVGSQIHNFRASNTQPVEVGFLRKETLTHTQLSSNSLSTQLYIALLISNLEHLPNLTHIATHRSNFRSHFLPIFYSICSKLQQNLHMQSCIGVDDPKKKALCMQLIQQCRSLFLQQQNQLHLHDHLEPPALVVDHIPLSHAAKEQRKEVCNHHQQNSKQSTYSTWFLLPELTCSFCRNQYGVQGFYCRSARTLSLGTGTTSGVDYRRYSCR